MICVKCGADVPTMPFCGACGWRQKKAPPVKHKRGNGQGSVMKLSDGRYKATVTLDYYIAEDGRKCRHTRSKIFELKKDALAAIPGLKESPLKKNKKNPGIHNQ